MSQIEGIVYELTIIDHFLSLHAYVLGSGRFHRRMNYGSVASWVGAEATLAGVELCSMLKQGQMIDSEDKAVWEQFYSLAA